MAQPMADLARDRRNLRRLVRRCDSRAYARRAAHAGAARARRRLVYVVATRIDARPPDPLAARQRIARLHAAGGVVPVPRLSRPASTASRQPASDRPRTGPRE